MQVTEIADMVRLSNQQRRIVDILASRHPRLVDGSTLLDILYLDDPDGGPDYASTVMHVQMGRLRERLEPHGWTIPRNRGRGPARYRLERINEG